MTFSASDIPTASLQGKVALVTGGGRGIGRAIALQLVRKGLTALAITYVGNKSTAEETAAQCLALGASKAIAVRADVLDPKIGSQLIEEVLSGLDTTTIDIVVNNAAIVDARMFEPLAQTTIEGFHKTFQGNVYSVMSIVNAVLPHLPRRNGRIINISSGVAREGPPDPLFSYGASKAALESVTRSMAMNLALEHLCTFNSVSVGATKTEAMEKVLNSGSFSQEFIDKMVERSTAERRIGEPEDVAMIVAWLASEESRWMNGACVMAHGGDRHMIPVQG